MTVFLTTPRPFIFRLSLRLLIPTGLLVWWALGTSSGWINEKLWASPAKVLSAWHQLNQDHFLIKAVLGSLQRFLAGFLAGTAAGFLTGTLLGFFKIADWLGSPLLNFLKNISVFAWLPLISLFFGIGEGSKVAFIAISAYFPLVFNTYAGIRTVQKPHYEVARVFKLNAWQRFIKMVLPSALPLILTGVQLAVILSWVATVGAEFFMSAGYSIGGFIIEGAQTLQFERVIIGVGLLGALGWVFNRGTIALSQRLLRNHPKTLKG